MLTESQAWMVLIGLLLILVGQWIYIIRSLTRIRRKSLQYWIARGHISSAR